MGRRDHKAAQGLRHPERNETGLVAGDIIPLPGLQLPCAPLAEMAKSRLIQRFRRGMYRMEAGWTSGNKIKQSLIQIFHWKFLTYG